jgi:hypothetical protein
MAGVCGREKILTFTSQDTKEEEIRVPQSLLRV